MRDQPAETLNIRQRLSKKWWNHNRGSNPLLQTQRGKLQLRRSTLNEQINKELRLRNGAENLLRATNDKRLKEQIALELNFMNSNIELLKEELTDLNTSVQAYQNEKCVQHIPLIPLGLKETKEINFGQTFKDFVSEHYSEDAERFQDAISRFSEMRHACVKSPAKTDAGVKLMLEYYNHLYFVEKRFFPPNRNLGIYFQWFDSLSGVPALQKSVALEKGSVLFNVASLYTQIGAKHDRGTIDGLQASIDCFCRAAGILQYLKDNFSHSPSVDMRWETLEALKGLLLAQSQECVYELQVLKAKGRVAFKDCFALAREAAQASQSYALVYAKVVSPPVNEFLPDSWTSLVLMKRNFYKAFAHFHTAVGTLLIKEITNDVKTIFRAHFDHELDANQTVSSGYGSIMSNSFVIDLDSGSSSSRSRLNVSHPPESLIEKKLLAKTQLRESVMLLEDCLQILQLSASLSKNEVIHNVLRRVLEKAGRKSAELDCQEDFVDLYEAASIRPFSAAKASAIALDLKRFRVEDLFRQLGPLAVFNARQEWSAPRVVCLQRTSNSPGFGFSVRGDAPVAISAVEGGGLADKASIRVGDYIVGIQRQTREWADAKWLRHEEVVTLIRESGATLILSLVTPRQMAQTTSPGAKLANGHHHAVLSHSGSASGAPTTTTASSYSGSTASSSNCGDGTLSRTPSAAMESHSLSYNSLKYLKNHKLKDKSKLSVSTWNIKKLFFSKQKFRSEPELTNPNIFMR